MTNLYYAELARSFQGLVRTLRSFRALPWRICIIIIIIIIIIIMCVHIYTYIYIYIYTHVY